VRRKGGEMAVSSFREQWRQALPLVGVPRLLRPWLREPGSLTARCLRHCRDFRVRLLRQESAEPLVDMGTGGRRCLPLREVLLECDGRPVVFAHSVLSASRSGALGRWSSRLARFCLRIPDFSVVRLSICICSRRIHCIDGFVTRLAKICPLYGRDVHAMP